MAYRATGNLSGAVTASEGDDLSDLPEAMLKSLETRGLVRDDGVLAVVDPPVTVKRRGRKGKGHGQAIKNQG